ncbi:MAG: membrane protein insertase YidC [Myxococcales bacterium]|nr:membrane protein insertase YidC [Myxococcales bacterium]
MDDQNKRLFLALILCAGVAILWTTVFAPPPMQPTQGSGQAAVEEGSGDTPTAEVQNGAAEGSGQAANEAGQETPVEDPMAGVEVIEPQVLAGNRFAASISNRGATFRNVQVLEPEQYRPRDDFGDVFPHGAEERFPYAVTIPGVPALHPDSVFEFVAEDSELAAEGGAEYSRIVYRWNDGQVQIDKVFSVDPERPYATTMDITLTDLTGRGGRYPSVDIEVWADAAASEGGGAMNPMANATEVSCFVNGDLEHEKEKDVGDMSEAEATFVGPTHWAGIQDRYFMTSVAVVDIEAPAAGCRFLQADDYFAAVLTTNAMELAPNGSQTVSLRIYTGPKDSDALAAAGSFLPRSVDYGMFTVLARPMKWILKNFYNLFNNWGLAIIFLTIVVKLIMFPMTQKSFKSMERMKSIQPKLEKVREKYKNDRSKMTEETMKLYKEHNVSPFGCLPMVLQMPIYIALYRTIYSSVELYKADFALWINDLSQADPYYILPVLMAITMFGQQLLTPTATDNPQMKWVMRIMPLMFGFFMLMLPSGLVLYIFVSSLLGIGQQWLIRRQFAREKGDDVGPNPDGDSSKMTRQQRRQAARQES